METLYFIGDVAKIIGIHDQTIRTYERKKLIHPKRTEKKIRVFTEKDITRITLIITLTQELGMTFNGVRLLFALARDSEMQEDELLDFVYDYRDRHPEMG